MKKTTQLNEGGIYIVNFKMSVDAFYEGTIYIVTSLKSVDAFLKKQFLRHISSRQVKSL